MAFQPFALDNYFEDMIKGGISQGKAQEDWFQDRTDEASMDLAAQAEAMKKKLKSAKGLFGSKLGGWGKALIPLLANMVVPGSGLVLGGVMAGTDAISRQKKYKRRLEDLKKLATKKGKYAGTFLENYMEQGLTGLKDQTKAGLKGLKQVDLLTGLLDVGFNVIPGLGKLGKGAAEVGKEAGKKGFGESLKEGLKRIFGDKTAYMDKVPQSDKLLNRLFAGIEKGINKAPLNLDFATNYAGESIMDQGLGSSVQSLAPEVTKSAGKNIFNTAGLEKLLEYGTKLPLGAYKTLTNPLINANTGTIGGQLISGLSTPSTYSSVIRDEAMDYLNPPADPTVVRAQNPFNRYRG